MALKKLLTDLETGLQFYPNQSTPSTAGGFNYGGGSIFNHKIFDQRDLKFGHGRAYDRPNEEFSREPLIGRNIDIPEPDENASAALGLIDSLSDGFVRGGAVTAISRSAKDMARITKFYLTSRGIGFLAKQVGLQLSNPKIEAGSSSFLGLELSRNRTFNLGLNLIAQAGVNFSGVHFDRAGLTPIWPEDQKYEAIVKDNANSINSKIPEGNRKLPGDTNRLSTLYNSHIKKDYAVRIGEEQEELIGQSKLGAFISKVGTAISNVGAKIRELTGKDQPLLYEYNGGPNSLYGIGKTQIRRYSDTNPNDEDTPNKFLMVSETHTNLIDNYLITLGRPGTDYQADAKGGRKYNRESRIGLGNPGVGIGQGNYRIDTHIRKTNTDGSLNYNVYDINRVDKINMLDVFKTKGEFNFPGVRDLIRFRFEAVDSDNPSHSDAIIFRAFLDDISDSHSANFNEFKYNGRGEHFYTYNSYKRTISLSFKIAAQTRHEMMPLYRKLNYLVSNTAPEYGKSGRIRTPFMRLTVGSWMDRLPGVLNNVNLKWQKDYPWEISISGPEGGNDKHMLVLPHVLDVSVNFTPIHNFLPEKSIHAPFILPHENNRYVKAEQRWHALGITEHGKASQLGIEKLQDIYNDKSYSNAEDEKNKENSAPFVLPTKHMT